MTDFKYLKSECR